MAKGFGTSAADLSLKRVETIAFDAGSEAYLCGPPGMVEAARARLLERGLVSAHIFNEEFVHAKA
ncbi:MULTISPECIES: hypothetical protein [Mesorhizobium]|uniref:hypothetical protein n=1 Tax=Mesorhizobium TaxID=68287 RepID=UPI0010A95890|nr:MULTISPECIES: hypothetical protein [Mesorhizobium]